MGLVQESKAEKAIDALKQMSAPTAKVKRDGVIKNIKGTDIVPGDILILETGNFVGADCRLINSYDLQVEESALTGETVPVLKNSEVILDKDVAIGDMVNTAFATTIVTGGHAEAVVVSTGMDTKVGQIAKLIINNESPETPLQQKLRRSWKKNRTSGTRNMLANIFNRNRKKNTAN